MPPVTLGKMNNFLEDEVDTLVGVPSNVPPSTLVGCLFELLRNGGSQVFLRRLWNQFRTTLPVESAYASVTWSKPETLVVLVQTLYPRVLRRIKSWLGDSHFSLALQSSHSGVKCIVRYCPMVPNERSALWTKIKLPFLVKLKRSACLVPCHWCRPVVALLL